MAILMKELNIFNNNAICIYSHSLGTLMAFDFLKTLYDLGGNKSVGDICMMGSVIDRSQFYENAHKLIGPNGVIKGKLYIFYTHNDWILSKLFLAAKFWKSPIGSYKLDYDKLAETMIKNDHELMGWNHKDVK